MIDRDVAAMTTWDVGQLRAAVTVLDAVLDRLPAAHHRFDEVTRTVWSGAVWSGPTGLAAAGSLSRMSAVAHSAAGALEDSLGWLRRAVSAAAEAQEVACRAAEVAERLRHGKAAVTLGATGADGLDLAALSAQLEALQDRARQHAADASAAAAVAHETVPRLDAVADLAPTSWRGWTSGLPGRHLVEPPRMPTGAVPEDTAAWWSVMSPAQQLAAIARDPAAVGALAGVPAWARDRANRVLLAQAVAGGTGADADTATAIAHEIHDRETAGETVQLLELDVREGLVALAVGDLDTADSIALLVPGVGTDAVGDLDDLVEDVTAIGDAALSVDPHQSVAALAWLSYRPPNADVGALRTDAAEKGGRALDRTVNGIAASRSGAPARTTVVAHSYGTVATHWAAQQPGDLPVDNVVVIGSPGMPAAAAELEADQVYEASSLTDPVVLSDWHGIPTYVDGFGAVELPVDWDTGHSEYLDPDRPTLTAVGEVVAGVR
ncbi:alpha/beta hydrolase [Geodermatophilus sp. DSM 44513]|uniref:alpha/beta hydrolase n=1 Tax=Geodermatophilus sp. DSM 44513 TaxID=1528104 RepID=UPI00126D5D57|nr:alpha/beta hydrolase [Geodermatophilus sp. DSM 44513]WNV76223.1 alpha/beta hydrolase [Geodermatophilus sp. DSM 44513]